MLRSPVLRHGTEKTNLALVLEMWKEWFHVNDEYNAPQRMCSFSIRGHHKARHKVQTFVNAGAALAVATYTLNTHERGVVADFCRRLRHHVGSLPCTLSITGVDNFSLTAYAQSLLA
jgi:hypothetical protein